MSGGEAEAGAKGGNAMVRTEGFLFGGDSDGGPGGRVDKGVGRDRRDGAGDGKLVKWVGYYSKHNLMYRA